MNNKNLLCIILVYVITNSIAKVLSIVNTLYVE